MAKEEQIKSQIILEGEKEYRAACKGINTSLREIGSEMKLATAEFGDNAESIEALTRKQDILQKSLEEQATLIEKTFQKVTVQEGDAEEETIKLVAEIADTDTKDLETGTYKYGVKLSTADGKVYTVITPSNFIIQEGIAK